MRNYNRFYVEGLARVTSLLHVNKFPMEMDFVLVVHSLSAVGQKIIFMFFSCD